MEGMRFIADVGLIVTPALAILLVTVWLRRRFGKPRATSPFSPRGTNPTPRPAQERSLQTIRARMGWKVQQESSKARESDFAE